jgi:hypothetical protein
MSNFKSVIISIVESHGESIENEDLYLDIEAESDAIENLSIERHGTELIVCQYYTQRADLMRDPEVRFRIEGDEWMPVEYRQDPHTREYCTDGLEVSDTLETWAVNLREQFL